MIEGTRCLWVLSRNASGWKRLAGHEVRAAKKVTFELDYVLLVFARPAMRKAGRMIGGGRRVAPAGRMAVADGVLRPLVKLDTAIEKKRGDDHQTTGTMKTILWLHARLALHDGARGGRNTRPQIGTLLGNGARDS